MKVLWIVLGVLFGLCLICAGGGYWVYSKGKGALDEAGKFGDESFRTIASSWNQQDFERLAPDIAKDDLAKLNDLLSTKLGPLKGEFTSHVTSFNARNNNGATSIEADWNADANFEKGPGHVDMKLLKVGDKWQVQSFNVESKLLQESDTKTEAAKPDEGGTKPDEPNLPSTGTTG